MLDQDCGHGLGNLPRHILDPPLTNVCDHINMSSLYA